MQFGEGGAGTFSDGKLWTQVKDPKHYGRKVPRNSSRPVRPRKFSVSKPHIGTFRLVKMVEHIRATIESLGGEFRFQHKVVDLVLEEQRRGPTRRERGASRGVVLDNGETLTADQVILAITHSARDTFKMLHERGVYIEPKPFSIGFRIEHPQGLIDRARFGPNAGNAILGAADYKLVHHASNGRSVYSFCMCPGGTVVAATSEEGRVVTNGMSQYSRNERNANAGIVVGIEPADFSADMQNPLGGIDFQRHWGKPRLRTGRRQLQRAGATGRRFRRRARFHRVRQRRAQPKPGVHLTDLATALPDYAVVAMREALPAFDKTIPGFFMPGCRADGGRKRAPVRRSASNAATTTCRASTSPACIRRVKAQAMPAASCRRVLMVSVAEAAACAIAASAAARQ